MNLKWAMTGSFFAAAERPSDGMRLGIFVGSFAAGKWSAFALETKDTTSAASVLNSHAHEIVGEYSDPPGAFKGATDYVAAWMKRTPAELCRCPDIGKPATRSRTSAKSPRRSPR